MSEPAPPSARPRVSTHTTSAPESPKAMAGWRCVLGAVDTVVGVPGVINDGVTSRARMRLCAGCSSHASSPLVLLKASDGRPGAAPVASGTGWAFRSAPEPLRRLASSEPSAPSWYVTTTLVPALATAGLVWSPAPSATAMPAGSIATPVVLTRPA
jgi:hypothetical protein